MDECLTGLIKVCPQIKAIVQARINNGYETAILIQLNMLNDNLRHVQGYSIIDRIDKRPFIAPSKSRTVRPVRIRVTYVVTIGRVPVVDECIPAVLESIE
jgi:hypothetical protein